jgi:hypothetical protein
MNQAPVIGVLTKIYVEAEFPANYLVVLAVLAEFHAK